MRGVVLLSGGIDPVSGRPAVPRGEVAAIGLALSAGGAVGGLHVGEGSVAQRQAGGYGLERVDCLRGGGDAVAILAAHLSAPPPDLVLAGSRACGGEDSGMLPYLLAERLGWPLLAGVMAIGAVADGWLSVTIGLPLGARQEARIRLPCILCAHDAAPAPPFVFDRARRVVVRTVDVSDAPPVPVVEGVERPYRARPRLIGSAGPGGGGTVLENPEPAEAARVLLAHLRALGMLGSSEGASIDA
ncbi:electron transfer flavoprotein subunit beta [Gluconacetobacter takamatsuzukensis]|uniref:Electron transfer flavoprotein subunit beta n=1 Tax=Gluconacetobacter takamatsuzukensis TaxID=1286190 RepID=A0A7W4KB22_9PROT|nr:electron transfer flavoprotein subunit beta [Gluconacetobacter takamatsuzukensis]MBB2203637.1 electron transfer flavoprotein subunit beta [Gluconacetobacter takamatsuzukensis]